MRTLLLTALLLASAGNAEVIKCPDAYPDKQITLPEVLAGHKGSGLLRGANLSTAFIDTTHELHSYPYGGFDAMVVVGKKVKGGEDIETNFTTQDTKRWLICVYGGNELGHGNGLSVTGSTEWWEKLDAKYTNCVLQIREVKQQTRSPSHWTAAAVCR
jgi:hypothetical protein